MSMEPELKHCPKCGTQIPADAPQGLCPKCLLAQASLATDTGKGGHKSAPPSLEALTAAFPQLEILELIGQGGMGFVFKARQRQIDRIVALKILPASLAADPAFAERFTREGKVLARLNHPNIVTIYDFGQASGFFYLLMEFVDGVNLREAMRIGRFTPEQALVVVPKICEALQFAHNEGILHRDIKPENILLDAKGRVKIADFGIAKLLGEPHDEANLTAGGTTLGTLHYMAPEQLEKPTTVDHRADIYSLGVVFYEMLTGELPLGRFQPPSRKVQMDVRLDEVVLHALEKEPDRRYQKVSDVKTHVDTIASTARVTTPPQIPSTATAPLPKDRFWRRFVIVVSVVLLAMVLIPVGAIVLSIALPAFSRARRERQEQPVPFLGPVRFYGVVTDMQTGKPIAGARLVDQLFREHLSGNIQRETTTDATGHFDFRMVVSEDHLITIGADGYETNGVGVVPAMFVNSREQRMNIRMQPSKPKRAAKIITLIEATNQWVGSEQKTQTIGVHTDSTLIPGEQIVARIQLPDGQLQDSGTSFFIQRQQNGVKTSSHFSWFVPASFSLDEIEAIARELRQKMTDRPLRLADGEPFTLFTATNKLGGVFAGSILYTRSLPDPQEPKEKVHATINFRPYGSGLLAFYSGSIPKGYFLEATSSAGEAFTGTSHYQSREDDFHSSWHPPSFVFPYEETQKAAEQIKKITAPVKVYAGQPVTLFSITNKSGEVFDGGFELVAPDSTTDSGSSPPAATSSPLPEPRLVIDNIPPQPNETNRHDNIVRWRFKGLIPPNHLAQVLFVRWTNGLPTIDQGFSGYFKVGPKPSDIEIFISYEKHDDSYPANWATQWNVSVGLGFTASRGFPGEPPFTKVVNPSRIFIPSGYQGSLGLMDFIPPSGIEKRGRSGVELRILLQPLKTAPIRTLPTEKDLGAFIAGSGLVGTLDEAMESLRKIPETK